MNADDRINGRSGGSRPLKVLFADSQAELGGAGFALLTMLEHMDRSQVSPVYVSLASERPEIYPRIESLGIPAFHIPAGRLRQVGRTARAVLGIRNIIKKEGIDLVLANSGHPLLFARPAAVATGRPCVWWVHGYVPENGSRREPIAVAQRMLGADALFSNSEFTARMLRQDFADHPAISVVRPGVDLDRFRPDAEAGIRVRQSLRIAAAEHVVGIFGRLQRWKGQHVLLRAAGILARQGSPVRVLVAGNSMFGIEPEYAGELRAIAQQPPLSGRVLFLGHQQNPHELMNACDVVVHASVEPEPWGLVVAEGMAVGRPVIASAAGGPLEMVAQGETGLLVPPGQPSQLADAIASLLGDALLRQRIGDAARRHAVEFFDPGRAASVLTRELQGLYQAQGGRNGSGR
jgi:glycosyltransferase involved in cell wall biosynthesis